MRWFLVRLGIAGFPPGAASGLRLRDFGIDSFNEEGKVGLRGLTVLPGPSVFVTLGFPRNPSVPTPHPLEGAIVVERISREYSTMTPLASGVLKAVHDTW